ncbi:RagB/SusD family nutrient uptake outer membrane protein [Parapedobacter tibetensis]|uniref:RagB/SusD family nutrient uptake outer membrane protein n=1 Tax=Parapedobacter tibetensis TaxID=2972951 RepID=UPI00214DDDEA|nr:RagB/SusD family nutrient uptake outer membrane protein [Parapedobacter tibetensis]
MNRLFHNKHITGLLLVFLMMAGCKSDMDFLTEEPPTFYTVDNAFSTAAQVDQVLVSLYSHMRDIWAAPDGDDWIRVFRGKGTDMYDVASIRRGGTFSDYGTINTNTEAFYEIYTTWYYVISRANLAIYAADLPQISWSSAEEKAHVLAQARFFRAFAYRNLGELFGGVPIVTEVTTVPRYDYERASRTETYQFAIDELEAVLDDLPETTGAGGRLVRGVAQHNLCELYLALGTHLADEGGDAQAAFLKSISYANEVIDGGTYSLMNTRFGGRAEEQEAVIDIYNNGIFRESEKVDTLRLTPNHYWDLFQEGSVNYQDGNRECIWALQVDYDAFKAEDGKSVLTYSRSFGPVFRDAAKDHMVGTLEDVGGRGISSIMPTMYTRDIIYEGKWADDLRNSDIVFRRRFKGNVPSSPYYLKPVPWEVMYNGSGDATTDMNNRSLCYPVSCKIATDKYTGLDEGQNRSNLFRDDYIIRLPETILLRAEAKQRMGDKAGAAADINLLRERAECDYLVSAADVDDAFNLILDERARELVYEECRWNTLLRMGGTIAVDRIREYAYWPETKATLTFNYNLWPIPQTVIDTNKDVKLDQNPGWENR